MMNSPLTPNSPQAEAIRQQQEAEAIRQRQKQNLMGWSGMAYMPPQWVDRVMNSDFPALYEQAQQGFPQRTQQNPTVRPASPQSVPVASRETAFNTMSKPSAGRHKGATRDNYAEVMGAALKAGYRV